MESEADYLLSVKENQSKLAYEISDYVFDESSRKTMDTAETRAKSRERIEYRTTERRILLALGCAFQRRFLPSCGTTYPRKSKYYQKDCVECYAVF